MRQAATDFTNAAVGSQKATQPGKALTNWALGRPQEKLTPAVHDGRGEYVTAIQNRHETKAARSEVMGELRQGGPECIC